MKNIVMRAAAFITLLALLTSVAEARDQWAREQANAWYARQPWPVGANYIPANAINQLEMWQAQTFDQALGPRYIYWARA